MKILRKLNFRKDGRITLERKLVEAEPIGPPLFLSAELVIEATQKYIVIRETVFPEKTRINAYSQGEEQLCLNKDGQPCGPVAYGFPVQYYFVKDLVKERK